MNLREGMSMPLVAESITWKTRIGRWSQTVVLQVQQGAKQCNVLVHVLLVWHPKLKHIGIVFVSIYLEFWQFPKPFKTICYCWVCLRFLAFEMPHEFSQYVAGVISFQINENVLETFLPKTHFILLLHSPHSSLDVTCSVQFHPSTFVRFEDYNWSFFSVAPSCNNNEKQRTQRVRGSASHMHKLFGVLFQKQRHVFFVGKQLENKQDFKSLLGKVQWFGKRAKTGSLAATIPISEANSKLKELNRHLELKKISCSSSI